MEKRVILISAIEIRHLFPPGKALDPLQRGDSLSG